MTASYTDFAAYCGSARDSHEASGTYKIAEMAMLLHQRL